MLASGKSPRASTEAELIGWQDEAPAAALRAPAGAGARARRVELQLETLVAAAPIAERPARAAASAFASTASRAGRSTSLASCAPCSSPPTTSRSSAGRRPTRRAYLDAALSQLDRAYYASLQRYARILQQRNASLKRIKEGIGRPRTSWCSGTTRLPAKARSSSRRARRAVRRLAHAGGSGAHASSRGAAASRWRSPTNRSSATSGGACCRRTARRRRSSRCSRRRWRRNGGARSAAGMSLVGPHRDDVSIKLNGVAASSFGSRAQIRTAALSLRLAEARLLRVRRRRPARPAAGRHRLGAGRAAAGVGAGGRRGLRAGLVHGDHRLVAAGGVRRGSEGVQRRSGRCCPLSLTLSLGRGTSHLQQW